MLNPPSKKSDNLFESIKHVDTKTKVEFWSARELMAALGYTKWENFVQIIKKTTKNIDNSFYNINDHILKVRKMVEIGSDTVRPVDDYQLSRYACYLVAMNSDAKKSPVALAKTYFAAQTRRQELAIATEKAQKRIDARRKYAYSDKRLSGIVMSRGVDGKGLAKIKSDGDSALFDGRNTAMMKKKYGLKNTDVLPDYLSPVVLAAKQLANEITSINTVQKDLHRLNPIDNEHKRSNSHVRQTLTKSGIRPENLPAEENVKKLERKLKKRKELPDETL